ncbi:MULTISPECIES: hypothetical protein [unclassified Chryseobacterium]|uniref:hypothetical protein n=1 Tax=unclassified Chryseobacterium TaxID=2593645 RepID=UPI000E0ABD27|nr:MULTISPECIES: hypothetical protein [unclassified Chryseobacterium]MDQ1855807.1 hypothetical protein [Chryseobacterium sp. WLY505]
MKLESLNSEKFGKYSKNTLEITELIKGGLAGNTSTSSSVTNESTFDTDSACPDCEKDPNGGTNVGLEPGFGLGRSAK